MPNKKVYVALPPITHSCNKFIYFSITFATKRNNTSPGITKKYHTEVVQKESITRTFKYAAFLLPEPIRINFILQMDLSKGSPQCYIPCDHKGLLNSRNLCSILHDEKLEKSSLKNPTAVKPELSHLKRTVWPLNLKQENRSSDRQRSKGFVKSLGNHTPCIVIPQYLQSMAGQVYCGILLPEKRVKSF